MTSEKSHLPGLPSLPPHLRVGVPFIDDEHLALIIELNLMIDNPLTLPESEAFMVILSRLGQKISTHFLSEEQFLKACGMPAHEVDLHFQAHTDIVEQYADLNFDLMNGKRLSRSDVLLMVKCWIVEHIVQHDLRIREYVSAQ